MDATLGMQHFLVERKCATEVPPLLESYRLLIAAKERGVILVDGVASELLVK